PYEPMYTMQDAEDAITHFVPYNYGQIIKLCDGIQVRFTDIGHLLGSASIEVWIEENDVKKKLVFSGDIGNINQPLIKDPQYIADADYVIIESTYGDRNHGEVPNYYEELASVIQRTFDRGGNVVIPSFAVGRTQELLYFMRKIIEMGMVKGYSKIPVYVDSPLANEATNIFNKNVWGYFDDEAMELVSKGINPISFPGLKTSVTSDDSKAINFTEESKVIISASGMCEAGRIKHHLKHNLWRKESTIVFVGFQAVGTLGRSILDGAKSVKLFGEPIAVNAEIVRLQGVSGHADQTGLIKWVNNFEPKPERVFVVHGETSVCTSFANLLHDEFALDTVAPYEGAVFDLESNSCLEQGLPPQPKQPKATAEQYRTSAVFARLCAAGERLMKIIRKNDQGANKDLAKFADQINAICDKWDR
ncbi:MAG: MBL fold metallo-hydrolase, partial [Oscillospiraceae bacterium]